MHLKALILLNALPLLLSRPIVIEDGVRSDIIANSSVLAEALLNVTKVTNNSVKNSSKPESVNNPISDWKQYAKAHNSNVPRFLKTSRSDPTPSVPQNDWMNYAQAYMGSMGSAGGMGGNNSAPGPNWNNGQGDGFGEPFRSQTGGAYRYNIGRGGNSSQTGGWQQYAAQPGSMGDSSYSSYMNGATSGNGEYNWQQYMGGRVVPSAASPVSAGGYFAISVEGRNLNVTTNFGLGQGRGTHTVTSTTSVEEMAAGEGGGGGSQNTVTARRGTIFIRGRFLNDLIGSHEAILA